MPRLISLFLLLSFLFALTLSLTSCSDNNPLDENEVESGSDVSNEEDDESNKGETAVLIAPTLRDFPDRRSQKFSKIEYKRPDIASLSSKIISVSNSIKANEISYESSLAEIEKIDKDYSSLLTNVNYVNIKHSENLLDEYWSVENSYLTEGYPSYRKAIEELLVTCARSERAEDYERDAFGEGLIEEYKDGGVMTDRLVALLENEAELENSYTSLSKDTIIISYKIFDDTYNNIIAFYEEHYGKDTQTYKCAKAECEVLYNKALSEKRVEIFINLMKVRRDISTEMGMSSYVEYAYEARGHDYTPEKMQSYLSGIKSSILPIYSILDYYLFQAYFNTTEEIPLDRISLINNSYYVSQDLSEEYAEIYSYMLGYELFSIEPYKNGRSENSFTTYLEDYDSPYLFVGCDGDINDYMTLAHEFGHFIDGFINGGEDTSLALMEVSSTAYELLSILPLSKRVGADASKYIFYSKIRESLTTILFQGFYALFEHYAYEIPRDEINENTLSEALFKAATDIGLNADALVENENAGIYSSLDYVLIYHLFKQPFYVESYALSSATALDIFFIELEAEGSGLNAYLDLVNRDEGDLTFEEFLTDSGLLSPFSKDYLKGIADKIHLEIFGTYLYEKRKSA